MKYNFDEVIDRSSNRSSKYDERVKKFGTADVIPLWVADMDFRTAQPIIDACKAKAEEGIWGYTSRPDSYFQAVQDWEVRRNHWKPDTALMRWSLGVVPALSAIVKLFSNDGDKVLIQTPVYSEFYDVVEAWDRTVVENKMVEENDHWHIDFADFEAKVKECSIFLLCNPHNPIGKVLTREEMLRLSDLAAKYDVRIFSDEIHAPFVYQGHTHVPFASINRQTAMQAFTSTSASKSFNIPGTKCAQVILTNPDDLELWMRNAEWSEHQTATIGAIATTAAYDGGAAWFEGVMAYIERNIALVNEQMRTRFAKVRYVEPQGTYIAWLDFSPLGIGDPANYFFKKANVALTDGRECGEVGRGCVRMNFAMPYPLLEECFDRMAVALEADGLL